MFTNLTAAILRTRKALSIDCVLRSPTEVLEFVVLGLEFAITNVEKVQEC